MDDNLSPTPAEDEWTETAAHPLDEHRVRVRQFASSQEQCLDDLEAELAQQVEELAKQTAQNQEVVNRRAGHFAEETQNLERLKAELDTRQRQLEAHGDEVAVRETALAAERAAHEESVQSIDRQRRLTNETRAELEKQHEKLLDRQADVKHKRRLLAREIKSRRQEHLHELEDQQNELARWSAKIKSGREAAIAELSDQCEDLRRQLRQQSDQLEQSRQDAGRADELARRGASLERELGEQTEGLQRATTAEDAARQQIEKLERELECLRSNSGDPQDELHQQLAHHKKSLNERTNQLNQQREEATRLGNELNQRSDEVARLRAQLETAEQSAASGRQGEDEQIAGLKREKDDLVDRVEALTSQVAQAESHPQGSADLDELNKRFEMAIEDVRELKKRNSELEEKLSSACSTPSQSADSLSGGFDWETQKQRLLASLEADFDPGDAKQAKDKTTIEGTIRITDQIIADKDLEITELKRLLDNQSNTVGDVAVGASAIAEMLDQDELIHQERENLTQMQEEWQEKLRSAEVEISLERAKIARQRADLENQVQELASRQVAGNQDKKADEKESQPSRGRWLEKLGLADRNEK